jgi:hypothetical protein
METITIDLFELEKYLIGEKTNLKEEFDFIENQVTYYDLSKEYEDYRLIIKRKLDNKYFELNYTDSPQFSITSDTSSNDNPIVAKEVFPETITKIIYR